jgi:hypothetical protein
LAQPVTRVRDLEVVVLRLSRRAVEEHEIVRQCLAWPEVERTVLEARHYVWQGAAGGLQVTLHADIELPLAREARGVDDCAADRLRRRLSARCFGMCAAWTVAALAVDALR